MYTPTREIPLHLSTNARVEGRDAEMLSSTLDEISSVNERLQEMREEQFRTNGEISSVTIDDAVDSLGGTEIPEKKLEEIERINNTKWRQAFNAILGGTNPREALTKYRGDSCAGDKHLRVSADQISVESGDLIVPLTTGSIRLNTEEYLSEEEIQFDEALIETNGAAPSVSTTGGTTSSSMSVEVNFVNNDNPREYIEGGPVKTRDARFIEDNIKNPLEDASEKASLVNILSQVYPENAVRDAVMFIEGETDTVTLSYASDANPSVAMALADAVGASTVHIPQRGQVVLSHRDIDIDVASDFPESQSLTDSQERELIRKAGYSHTDEDEMAEKEILAKLYFEGAINDEEVENYEMCWWTPTGSSDVETVYEAIEDGRLVRETLDSFENEFNVDLSSVISEISRSSVF